MNKPKKILRIKKERMKEYNFIQYSVKIDKEVKEQIKKIAQQENLTIREVFTIACQQYIDKYNNTL